MPIESKVPRGVIPYLSVREAKKALDFYQRALGAEVLYELEMPDGRLGHAELSIGGARLMLADEYPEMGFAAPATGRPTSVVLSMYVDDVDALAERAVNAGATLQAPIKDEFYGDRVARLVDPFGHVWSLQTRMEEVSPEEMRRRMATGFSKDEDRN